MCNMDKSCEKNLQDKRIIQEPLTLDLTLRWSLAEINVNLCTLPAPFCCSEDVEYEE